MRDVWYSPAVANASFAARGEGEVMT